MADAAREPPSAAAWSYANLGWCVLGRVIETATDAVWEDAMRCLALKEKQEQMEHKAAELVTEALSRLSPPRA